MSEAARFRAVRVIKGRDHGGMPTLSELRARVDGLPDADRDRFTRRLGGAGRIEDPERLERVLGFIERDLDARERGIRRRRVAVPETIPYPEELPITARRDELLDVIRSHQVVVVAGETGSGKSTQLPKLCLEVGRGVDGMIAHTQPRRIAARSIAERVAEELGTDVGAAVGYAVRFTDRVGDETLIKVMTDGLLLAEIQSDPELSRYDTVIIDEAHERSLTIDFLLGYLRRLLPRRPDLKVIITSATIDTARFAAHFDDAPVVQVSGRTHPVEVRYRPLGDDGSHDVIQGITDAAGEIADETTGDILVFCSGEREIRDAVDALEELRLAHTEVVPLYGRLSVAEQHRVFEPHRGRRIVVATNVAETSLTVPGMRAVIDTGTARISRYSRRTKVQRLPIEPVSRASADQRAGRCGRIGPGVCIRLYAEDDYLARPEFTEPEIRRTNLASVILRMAALGLGDIESFPFLDPPDVRSVRDGVSLLEELGAVEGEDVGERRWLTETGRALARLPLDPSLGRMLVEADRNGTLREVSTIVAALSIQDPRDRPEGREADADRLHARFDVAGSDFMGWLRLWEHLSRERKARSSSGFRRMCRDEFLNYRRIREWQDVRGQIRDITDDLSMRLGTRDVDSDAVHRALLSGLLSQVGMKEPAGFQYRGTRGARFSISPASVLFKRAPEWVMVAELVETSRTWAHQAAAVDPATIEDVASHVVKRSHSDPWWDFDRGTAMTSETVTLHGLALASGRPVVYGRIDPAGARELFIRHALVLGEWETHHDFAAENDARIAEILDMEARKRSADLLADEDRLTEFFDVRIPSDVWSVAHFDRWWRDARTDHPDLLVFTPEALIADEARAPTAEEFPTEWHHGDLSLPVTYEFDPASPADGVTVDVPLAALDRLDPAMVEWQVPGLRTELLTELIRSLPKRIRTRVIPLSETVAKLRLRVGPADGRLLDVLRKEVSHMAGMEVLPDDFDLDRVPRHLVPRIRVVDERGEAVAEGSDLERLRTDLAHTLRREVAAISHPLERTGLVDWPGGTIPTSVDIAGLGAAVAAYPALVDEGESVGLRLMATPDDQAAAMWAGTRRLLTLGVGSLGRRVADLVTEDGKQAIASGPHRDLAAWREDCLAAAVDDAMARSAAPVWTEEEYRRLESSVHADLPDALYEVAATTLAILDVYRTVAIRLDEMPDVFEDIAMDMARQVNRLVYPGFVTAVGSHLGDVERYLAGVLHRIARVAEDPGRDRDRMDRVAALEARHDHLLEVLPTTPELADLGWDLQELRMALFAQSLGVEGSVSEKRLWARLDAVAGGGAERMRRGRRSTG